MHADNALVTTAGQGSESTCYDWQKRPLTAIGGLNLNVGRQGLTIRYSFVGAHSLLSPVGYAVTDVQCLQISSF